MKPFRSAIKGALFSQGVKGLRADDKQYHDDVLHNVLTYAHGCGFGIAVFERIESEAFNPNVPLEVGYQVALGKEMLWLKNRTLRTLPKDLIGRLYKEFDPLNPETAVAEVVHDIDLKDGKYQLPEASGIAPLIEGIALRHADCLRRLEEGAALFESLYARFRSVHPLKVGGSKRPKGGLDSKSALSSPPEQHKAEGSRKVSGKSKIKRRPARSKR